MRFTEEMINEDEKRWHARNVVTELRYCGNYMCDRKDMNNTDIRFYAYIMRKAYYMLKEQPEIVRCKDCISWTAGRCGAFDIAMGPEDFCSKAYPFVFGREKNAD